MELYSLARGVNFRPKHIFFMEKKGYILIARQIEDSAIWQKPSDWLKIWLYLILAVNHTDGKFKRGEMFFTSRSIALETHSKVRVVERCISWLKKEGMVAVVVAVRGSIISLPRFAKFQDIKFYGGGSGGGGGGGGAVVEVAVVNDKVGGTKRKEERIRKKEERKKKKPDSESETAIAYTTTPRDDTNQFFTSSLLQDEAVSRLAEKGVPEITAKAELTKFMDYWTELTQDGKRQRWQKQETFEVGRRLATWFKNMRTQTSNKKTWTII